MNQWIKIEHITPDKPEVFKIAEILDIDPDCVVGKLVRLWIWLDQQSVNGNALSVTKSVIDRITFAHGFADAMLVVGWIEDQAGLLSIPRFDRHNGRTAKNRCNTNRRVADHRKCNAQSVTSVTQDPLPKALPKALPDEDEDEDEDSKRVCIAGEPEIVPWTRPSRYPTEEQAVSAAAQIGVTDAEAREWWSMRESSEWTRGMAGGGSRPVASDWRQDLKTVVERYIRKPRDNGHATAEQRAEQRGDHQSKKIADIKTF